MQLHSWKGVVCDSEGHRLLPQSRHEACLKSVVSLSAQDPSDFPHPTNPTTASIVFCNILETDNATMRQAHNAT